MAVVVTMEVGSDNWSKFQAAIEWMDSQPSPGLSSTKVYRSEANPDELLVIQEWDSHESFHSASDMYGDEFNRRAGTEGLYLRTGVWTGTPFYEVSR